MTEEQVLAGLKKIFSSNISKGKEVASIAIDQALKRHDADEIWIKKNFSALVEEIQVDGYDLYLESERVAADLAFRGIIAPLINDHPSKEHFMDILRDNFWALDKFFLGLTQGRKPRAGITFEYLIKDLFSKLRYPYSYQAVINGKPDFLLPSEEHFKNNAMDCIIFTVKRTLRERWRQIVTEGIRGHRFFLATIDEKISQNALTEMLGSRIYVVVPERIKNSIPKYEDAQNVITFEEFFEQHLDPAMERWKTNNIVN